MSRPAVFLHVVPDEPDVIIVEVSYRDAETGETRTSLVHCRPGAIVVEHPSEVIVGDYEVYSRNT